MKLEQYPARQAFAQHHLLALANYSQDEICQILSLALTLKQRWKQGRSTPLLTGKTLAMIFAKSSTRTRVSFEVGAIQLGGAALFLSSNDIQLGRGETIGDTAKVLSRMVDAIMIRTFRQSDVEELAAEGSIPVINGLTDLLHPCQALADILTLYEHRGELPGKKLAFIGDGNNVCHSLMVICAKLGIHFSAAFPEGYAPDAAIAEAARGFAARSGAELLLTDDPAAAANRADAVYTDVWASMGQESEARARLKTFRDYTVTPRLMAQAHPEAIFLHCLPAHRGEEVAPEVIDGPQSAVFDEAENRLHAQKAVMALLMSGRGYDELITTL